MHFPKAYTGVKIIIVAEIIALISALCFRFPSRITTLLLKDAQYNSMEGIVNYSMISFILIVLFVVFLVMSNIVMLIGTIKSSKEEKKFKEAYIVVIISIVVFVVSSVIDAGYIEIIGTVESMFSLWVMVATIQGYVNISDKCEDIAMADRGIKIIKVVLFFYGITVIVDIVFQFVLVNPSFYVAAIVIAIVEAVLEVIAFGFYIFYLFKVKKMLKLVNGRG